MLDSNFFMAQAIRQARTAHSVGEVPVGAVLVFNKQIVVASYNNVEALQDPTAHAEMLAIKAGTQVIQNKYLDSCDLYVTLEPCHMCFYALSLTRVRNVYFGAYDKRNGAAESIKLNITGHKPRVYGGIEEKECTKLIAEFFLSKRHAQ